MVNVTSVFRNLLWVRTRSRHRHLLTNQRSPSLLCRTTLACLAFLLFTSSGAAQEWAKKMFETKSHDFGTIARGSKAVYKFELKNILKETVHVRSVRSSCGCTDSKIVHPTLKTWETGEIVAAFNTRSFQGSHSATLTVVIDKPYPAEVQLQVYGNIRSDVVFQPGSIQFGAVDQGGEAMRRVTVKYAGRGNWKIEDVRSAFPHFEVELEETVRGQSRVSYELLVRLLPTAPPGYVSEQLILITDDQRNLRIPLGVEGQVRPSITVSPQQMVLGEVPSGKAVTKKLIVRGKQPFKIVSVDCDDDCFTFKTDDESKKLHLLTVKFLSPKKLGKVEHDIRIRTDLGEMVVTLSAFATVVAAAK